MLPSNDKVVGDFGHTSDHNLIVSDIQDIRDTFLGASVAAFTYLRQDVASATYVTQFSPNLLGIPTAPTASAGTDTDQIATTAFVSEAIDLLIDAAPGVLDTLNELAAAIGDDPNFITSIGASVSLKLDSGVASATYLTLVSSSLSYLRQDVASATYLTQLAASALYIPISASYEFLRQDVASATYLPITGSVNWSNIVDKPDPVITLNGDVSGVGTIVDVTTASITVTIEKDFSLTFTGDVTGTGTVNNLGSASIALTVQPDSVALGTDTTGNYVLDLAGGEGITISGSIGEGWIPTVSINSTASVNWENVNNKPDPIIGVNLTGDVTGAASATLVDLANGQISIATTVEPDSVALGTDTTGDYVANIFGTDNQIAVAGSGVETASVVLSLPQDINTISSPTFASLTLTEDLAVNGGDISSTSSAFHLLNQPANINIGLSASVIEVGSVIGTTNINNNLNVDLNVNIDGGAITTSASSFNIVNDVSYQVNFGGAAQAINIGSASGTTTVANNLTVDGDTLIYGDLTVMGSTTTVNSTTTTLDDPIITLGGDETPTVDDNKDRGVEFKWHDGTSSQLGFFGFDDSTGRFSFKPKSINTSEVFSGSVGGFDLDHIQFNTATITSPEEGRLVWNNDDGTLDLGLRGGDVTLQVGQENVFIAFNNSGTTIYDGMAVAIDGAQGNRVSIVLANSASSFAASHAIGIATETILAGEEGYITTYGTVRQLNTASYSEGTELYVSASPGILTSIRPPAPLHAVSVGFVQRSHHQVGSIFVRVDDGNHLEFLHDVRLNNPLTGQALLYNQSASYWENISIADIYLRQDNASATYLTLVSASSSFARLDELEETVEDYVGAMFAHNQHNNVTAAYNDSTGRVILTAAGGGGGATGGNLALTYWFGV